ncbi:hypothetical protein ACFU3E_34785 [Streptomyces sp. NPDC057424]|uniref:hypothetical protein n=1 Tax=Streptomyces sp. NPDC057424 TaxID=3346127 RepID=UPI00369254B4
MAWFLGLGTTGAVLLALSFALAPAPPTRVISTGVDLAELLEGLTQRHGAAQGTATPTAEANREIQIG